MYGLALKIAAALLSLLCLVAGPARAAEKPEPSCKNKVVIYLDVSGSMTNPAHRDLLDRCKRFVCQGLLDPANGVVALGDQVLLRGFISRVDDLAEGIVSFHPPSHLDRLRKQLARGLHAYRRFMDSRGHTTDFTVVVHDMTRLFKSTDWTAQRDFHQLVFILVTDGEHDRTATIDDFVEAIKALGRETAQARQQGLVKVFFFGLPASRGAGGDQNVTPDFTRHLGAINFVLAPDFTDPGSLHRMASLIADRIEIDAVTRTFYDYDAESLAVEFHTRNPSCKKLSLEKIKVTLAKDQAGSKQKEPSWETKKIWEQPLPQEIPPGGSPARWCKLNLPLSVGRYRVEMIPVSQGEKEGAPVTKDFQVSEGPPPVGPLLVILLLLAGLALAGWFWWKRGQEDRAASES